MRTPYAGGDAGSTAKTVKEDKKRTNRKFVWMLKILGKIVSRISKAIPASNDPRSILCILLTSHGAQIDPQLLRFLIQVTALQAKRFRGETNVLMAPFQL